MSGKRASIEAVQLEQVMSATEQLDHGLEHLDMLANKMANDKQMDDAVAALQGQNLAYTTEEEKALVRRLDWILMPLMALGIGLQLVDKSALGSAATLTIQKDLHLHGKQYSWAVSIYYFGLLLGTYPANLLLQRFHTGRVIAIAYICWSITMFATVAIEDFTGLAVVRFFLGIFESAAAPGFSTITARFYAQAEQPFRYSIWNTSTAIFPIPFLVIFYGIGRLSDHPLQPWRWIFVLLGALTFVAGILIWFFMPDTPNSCRWLTPHQRAIAVERVAKCQTGIKNHVFRFYQAKEALLDIKLWLNVSLMVWQQSGVSLQSNFSGIIIKSFGFSGLNSLLLQIPGWAVAAIGVPFTGWLGSHVSFMKRAKSLYLAAVSVFAIICASIIYTHPPNPEGTTRPILLTFLSLLNYNAVGYAQILSMVGQNCAGATKRQTALTMTFVLYCVSNIVVPQTFKTTEAPKYHTFILTVIGFMCMYVICGTVLFFLGRRENARRDRLAGQDDIAGDMHEEDILIAGLADETDQRNLRFRYAF